jgi:hypothetical protein
MTKEALLIFAFMLGCQCVLGFLMFLWLRKQSHHQVLAHRALKAELTTRENRLVMAAQRIERILKLGR